MGRGVQRPGAPAHQPGAADAAARTADHHRAGVLRRLHALGDRQLAQDSARHGEGPAAAGYGQAAADAGRAGPGAVAAMTCAGVDELLASLALRAATPEEQG